ncbi:MAG: TMEM198/TM7SF3 family protein [Anaerolineaceae bacterium]|nr:TMEM198/TM7SF3 family protein [Anaerolineaceae bacterium]
MQFLEVLDLGAGGTVLVAILTIAFGLLNCFFGYRIFRFMLALWGLVLGAYVGATVAGNLADGQLLWVIVGGVVGAILGAVLMSLLYFLGVFVVGAAAGAVLADAVGVAAGIDMPTLVVIIVAVVVGIIALILQRVVLILATAFLGAWAVVSGALSLLAGTSTTPAELYGDAVQAGQLLPGLPSLVVLLAWLVLALLGAVTQFAMTRERAVAPPPPPVPRDRW